MKIEKRQDKLEIKVGELEEAVTVKLENVDKEMVRVKNKLDKEMEKVWEKFEELDNEKIRDIDTIKKGFSDMKDKCLSEIKEEVISEGKEMTRISGNTARAEAQKMHVEQGNCSGGRKDFVESTAVQVQDMLNRENNLVMHGVPEISVNEREENNRDKRERHDTQISRSSEKN